MKHLYAGLLILINLSLSAQITNPQFENWEIYNNNWERPVGWNCQGVTSTIISCKKFEISENNLGVRIKNSLPCIMAEHDSDFRSPGSVISYFKAPFDNFMLSYRVIIDSIENPAKLIVTLKSPVMAGDSKLIYSKSFNGMIDEVISDEILGLSTGTDLILEFRAVGEPSDTSSSSCNAGFVSAVIDDVVLEEVVGIAEHGENNLLIYPNPFDEKLIVESPDEPIEKVSLYDVYGRLVTQEKSFTNQVAMTDLNLAQGVYLMEVVTRRGKSVGKVLKR